MLKSSESDSVHEGCASSSPDGVARYSREQMMMLRNATSSQQRPDYLSAEFNGEDGKFLPEKWLEYRWICEGVENRPNANVRRKEKLKVEALEGNSTVLSPQRRGFSSGCRAASPFKNEAESERLGASKGSWRSGAGFQLKNSNPEFKHKVPSGSNDGYSRTRSSGTTGSSDGKWRSNDNSFRQNYHRDATNQRGKHSSTFEEKVPEWLNEGPTSMLDMIELRGFDEDNKPKGQQKCGPKKAVQNEKHKSKQSESIKEQTTVDTQPAVTNEDLDTQSMSLLNGTLPDSDAELAAIIGLLGEADLNTLKQNELKSPPKQQTPPVTGSRLSRFFATSTNESGSQMTDSSTRHVENKTNMSNSNSSPSLPQDTCTPANSILHKLFTDSSQRPSQQQLLSVEAGAMRVEDLERNFQQEASKNTLAPSVSGISAERFPPKNLCQPFSPQVGATKNLANAVSNDNPATGVIPPLATGQQFSCIPVATPNQSQSLNPQSALNDWVIRAAILKSQYDNALAQNMQSYGSNPKGIQLPQTPTADSNAFRHLVTSMITTSSTMPPRPVLNVPAHHDACRPTPSTTLSSTFMPTSVMRQLTKNNVSVEEKLRHNSSAPTSTSHFTSTKGAIVPDHQSGVNKLAGEPVNCNTTADLMAKLAMQQQYAQMLSAMHGQLPLGAWRLPSHHSAIAAARQAAAVAHLEQQRQMALSMMRGGDPAANQLPRPRLMPQQQTPQFPSVPNMIQPQQQAMPTIVQATSANVESPHHSPCTVPGGNSSQTRATSPFRYQNPLEKLLQSAGVASVASLPPSNPGLPPSSTESGTGSNKDVPSIVSRLPPFAKCISVEELEKHYSSN